MWYYTISNPYFKKAVSWLRKIIDIIYIAYVDWVIITNLFTRHLLKSVQYLDTEKIFQICDCCAEVSESIPLSAFFYI